MNDFNRKVKIHNSFHDTVAVVALHGDYHGQFIKEDAYRRARKKLCGDKNCDCHIHDAVWNGVYDYEQRYVIASVAQTIVR